MSELDFSMQYTGKADGNPTRSTSWDSRSTVCLRLFGAGDR
ncbi:MAG: hypothetical protein ACLR4Z_03985 [Butyricicoccaceae bacterium]